LFTEKVKC